MTLNDQLIQMQANLESAKTHIADLEKGRKASSSKARSEQMKVKKSLMIYVNNVLCHRNLFL